MSEFDFLEEQGVSAALIKAAEEFRQEYGVSEEGGRCFRTGAYEKEKY